MSDVVAERHGAVLVCRLNRPTARNGLTGALLVEYLGLLADARADDAVRVVVTTGEGDAFSAGADVDDLSGETARQGLNALLHERLGLTGTLSAADRAFDRLGIGRETLAIMNYDKPLIAAVNGAAAGGGFALAMLHDIRLASERAKFTSAFVRIGLVAEMGLSYTLPRAIGLEAAMDVMCTGRSINADEARELGLVRKVVAHEHLMAEAIAYAELIAAQPPSRCNSQSALWFDHLTATYSLNSSSNGRTKSLPLTPMTHARASPRSASAGHHTSAVVRRASTTPA
jgi:enoyl-CoA hydratase/carnithine racemase